MPSAAIPAIYEEFNDLTLFATFQGGFTVTGSRLRESSTGVDNLGGRLNGESFNNQYSEIGVPTFTTGGKAGAAVRCNGTSTWNMALVDLPAASMYLYRVDIGIYTQLSTVAVTVTVPFTVRAEIIGATLYGYINGTLVDFVVDTAPLASGRPGLYLTGGSSVANQEIDNWEAGPLAPGTHPMRRHPQSALSPPPMRPYRLA